jgi:hypothetical protein
MFKLFPQSKYVAKKISKRPLRKLLILFFFALAFIYFLCFSSSTTSIGGSNEDGSEIERDDGGGGFFGGDYFSSNSEGNKGHYLPGCVIIGVRKCGTRALLDMLNLHPQVRIFILHIYDLFYICNYI